MEAKHCIVNHMRFNDVKMFEGAIRGGYLRPCQMGRQPEASEIIRVAYHPVCLDVVSAGPSMLYEGSMPDDCYTLSFVLHCPGGGRSFNFGLDFTAGWMGFFAPGAVLDGFNPPESVNAILTVPIDVFHEAAAVYFPEISEQMLSSGCGVKIGAQDQKTLGTLIWTIMAAARSEEKVMTLERGDYGQQLLPVFMRTLREGASDGKLSRKVSVGRYRKFRNARDYIMAQLGKSLQVHDICKAVELSERGLENLFKDMVGLTPVTYLRHQRLHHAYGVLSTSSYGSGQIKEAAMESGFSHLGRFSNYYQQMFGEKPSDTLGM